MTKPSDRDAGPRRTGPVGRWRHLSTERRHPASESLDRLSSAAIVALLLEEDRRGLEAALRHRDSIARAAGWIAETLEAGGDVVLAGAGTSGRLAVLEAAECPPTFGTEPERIRAVIAGGSSAVFRALEGAEDRAAEGRWAVQNLGGEDLLMALSASAVTPFARGALAGARAAGARTVLLTCSGAEGLHELADLVVALDTGPEILTGSTRLKAGSATKAVLNAITTTAMVRLGKVFGNLMVDLRPGSDKLRDRAVRIVEAAAAISRNEAIELYRAADGEVKTAILMALGDLSPAAARRRLEAAGGHLRRALEAGDSEAHAGQPDPDPQA